MYFRAPGLQHPSQLAYRARSWLGYARRRLLVVRLNSPATARQRMCLIPSLRLLQKMPSSSPAKRHHRLILGGYTRSSSLYYGGRWSDFVPGARQQRHLRATIPRIDSFRVVLDSLDTIFSRVPPLLLFIHFYSLVGTLQLYARSPVCHLSQCSGLCNY